MRALFFALAVTGVAAAQMGLGPDTRPWMDKTLNPDARADLVMKEMTLDEKISLLHGNGMAHVPQWQMPLTNQSNGGAGFVVGIPRLGLPPIDMSDAAYGVRMSGDNGRYSTALPSNLASAASWDTQAAYRYGALIGYELRAQGYTMTLGGGVNLTREPRNGRTFEYLGEDPILAGTLVGQVMKGLQAQHVIGDIKHYAVNDQETGRNIVNAIISKRAMREGDILPFEIGLRDSDAQAVMCSYNRVNGDYACENRYLLTDVLKNDLQFKGFVLSDWGGTHSTVKASAAGLDNEEPMDEHYGPALKKAVQSGEVPMAQLDDHVHRILRAEFAAGIVDHPPQRMVIDVEHDLHIAEQIEEQSIVLLQNKDNILPLDSSRVHSVAVIGAHADIGMISGGGSAQVDPPNGNALSPGKPLQWQEHVWFPTAPLSALKREMRGSSVEFASGDDLAAAADLAKRSDVAIVFAQQWESEGMDLPSLALPDNQDALIEAVAAANPHTVVVLESGTAVLTPWSGKVAAIVEAWYGGSRGANAVADILTGDENPCGKLPITFPKSDADLPHLKIPALSKQDEGAGSGAVNDEKHTGTGYSVTYDEGLKIGYKWYDAEKKPVAFPFGFGLSYTTYQYSGLKVMPGQDTSVTFTITNTGNRTGREIAEVYAMLPENAGEPPKRLVGFTKVQLRAGESREVTVNVEPKYLSIFNESQNSWQLLPGEYTIAVGGSSADLPLKQQITIK